MEVRKKSIKQKKTLGRYKILKNIAIGGMGKVYLAFDPICKRHVALKEIRDNLRQYKGIRERFLREAIIPSQLSHPSIISIYSIHEENDLLFYTMPYIEGETLKKILQSTKEKLQKGSSPHPIGVSLPRLVRIFHNICLAVAYAHSKGILHRDLKLDNIIVGKFEDVLILDWGIAEYAEKPELQSEEFSEEQPAELTQPGKVLGTVNYLAPERAKGQRASYRTDIYSLGVLFYQLLTLQPPFFRNSLSDFRKNMHLEQLLDPHEVAPHRDIPRQLSKIVKKCLAFQPVKRYQSVIEILRELENYIEGRPEWVLSKTLDIKKKEDWKFQENVPIAKHIALTRSINDINWVYQMFSKNTFTGNIKIEADLTFDQKATGMGFLLNVPKPSAGLEEGFCLWLNFQSGIKLYRSNVEVMEITNISLHPQTKYHLVIQKMEDSLQLFIDGKLMLNYVSHIPLFGDHIGFLSKDLHFDLSPLHIYLGSYSAMTNCLSIPDAFLASKNLTNALKEYRRIAISLEERTEGREALFRAGLTLIEQAKKRKKEKKHLLSQALEEFEKLKTSPGAPLEYLGKSFVYAAENDIDEEIKCFELVLRKHPKHPILQRVEERVAFRLCECAKKDRKGAYLFALLALQHLPHIFNKSDEKRLLENIVSHWETLPFIEQVKDIDEKSYYFHIATQIAFWLSKPLVLKEMLSKSEDEVTTKNILLCLNNLRFPKIPSIETKEAFLKSCPKLIAQREITTLLHFIEKELTLKKAPLFLPYLKKLEKTCTFLNDEIKNQFLMYKIWTLLLSRNWNECAEIFSEFPNETLSQNGTLLHLLHECYLISQKISSSYLLDSFETGHPPLFGLLGHYLQGKISFQKSWKRKAFYWEKRSLFQQLTLYYHCLGNQKKALEFEKRKEKLEKALYETSAL